MLEPTPDLTPAPTYFELVEPTLVTPDGRRMWRLTEDVRVTIHPDGRIEQFDNATSQARELKAAIDALHRGGDASTDESA